MHFGCFCSQKGRLYKQHLYDAVDQLKVYLTYTKLKVRTLLLYDHINININIFRLTFCKFN